MNKWIMKMDEGEISFFDVETGECKAIYNRDNVKWVYDYIEELEEKYGVEII